MNAVLQAAAEAESTAVAPAVVGLLTFGVLVSLLLVTYAFRNIGQRH